LFKCEYLDENIFNDFSKTDFNLKSLNIDLMREKVLKSFLQLTNRNLEKISFNLNTSSNVIQDFFIRCSNISDLKIIAHCKVNFLFLSILENSLTHLTFHFYSFDYEILSELSKISLPKL